MASWYLLLSLACILQLTASQNRQPNIFINCGVASFFTDFQGNGWVGDMIPEYSFFNVGVPGQVSAAINGTFEDIIYQTERWEPESEKGNMTYEIPVEPGSYQVILHFAEVFLRGQYVGSRVFNVSLEGEVAYPFVDIYAEAGGFTALTKEATTTVKDGNLTIDFTRIVQNPKINGIEIRPIYVPSVRINCGGPSYVDSDGNVWTSDIYSKYHNGGSPNTVTNTIEQTTDELLYRTERWYPATVGDDVLRYDIPIINGVYDVYLHWAETYHLLQYESARQFDVFIQGHLVFAEVDIYREVGGYAAMVRSTPRTAVSNGIMTIEIRQRVQNPKLCAIEIHPEGRRDTFRPKTLHPIYINAGSSASYTDSSNVVWGPDDFYNAGNTYTNKNLNVSATSDPELYRSHRWNGKANPVLTYDLPVSVGEYTVKLHFCETFSMAKTAGYRVFDIRIENELAFENVDIVKHVGQYSAMTLTTTTCRRYSAMTLTTTTYVSDNALTIELLRVIQNPLISAIEVQPNFNIAPPKEAEFKPILINAGSKATYTDSKNRTWAVDAYFNGGKTLIDEVSRDIAGTVDDGLYQSERWADTPFTYEIPLPDGTFNVSLYFAELYSKAQAPNKRVFDVTIEGVTLLDDLDIFQEVGGNTSMIRDFPVDVSDGALTVDFIPGVQNPKISAIEIVSIGKVKVHQAHAVPGGPYIATDTDNDGQEIVPVDGRFSHTHGPGARLVLWNWKIGNVEIGFGEKTQLTLPIGFHNVSLEVRDSEGDTQTSYTNITVRPYGFPVLKSIDPTSGNIAGGDTITLIGQGFNFSASQTSVHFGGKASVTGSSAITVKNFNTLEVVTPKGIVAGLLDVSVVTPIGRSNTIGFTYIDGTAVTYKPYKDLYLIGGGPTAVVFGPDERLYIATQAGDVVRLTLDENYQIVDELVSKVIGKSEPPYRVILGLAFDPMDTKEFPDIYVAHSFLFHKQDLENSYNGKVSTLGGPNLDIMTNIITGLPVSDHDHAVNGLEFTDDGNLMIQVGGNTNAGVPGPISSREDLDEGYFSAATLIAYLSRDNFDGFITYDDSTGKPITGLDVELFATGERNSYDICLHSNGNLYATDNGPNESNGKRSLSCDDEGPDPKLKDKLNLIRKDHYYGHANRLRGRDDPRQCIWRNGEEEQSDEDYTAPMLVIEPSSDGIIEYESNHFGGQLRGRLIIARYLGELWTVALSEDGESALSDEILLDPNGGLDVAMGPDGTLFVAKNGEKKVIYLEPLELAESNLVVKSVFPRRGPQAGGSRLRIYGVNMDSFGTPTVSVGGVDCPLDGPLSSKKITCILPPGSGAADIVVTASDGQTSTFERGYRYITGGKKETITVVAPPEAIPASITEFVLVDAMADTDIPNGFNCTPYACTENAKFLNIRAETTGPVHSVLLTLTGPTVGVNRDYTAPYTVFGDLKGNYVGGILDTGDYTVTGQIYDPDGNAVGSPASIKFKIAAVQVRKSLRR